MIKTIGFMVMLVGALMIPQRSWARAEKSMVGQKLPELKLKYLQATPEVAGKPVILEFWATWCPPCRQSIPHLYKIYAQNKEKGLIIIGVTNEKKDVVEQFLKSNKMDYYPAVDAQLGNAFQVTGIPHAVMADRTGKIVREGHPASITDKELSLILK